MKKFLNITFSAVLVSGLIAAGIVASAKNNPGSAAQTYEEKPVTAAAEIVQESTEELAQAAELQAEERSLGKAVDVRSATKDDVFHMMLNSIDYYDRASGIMVFSSDHAEIANVVQFQSDLSQTLSYSRYTQCNIRAHDVDTIDMSVPVFENIIYCSKDRNVDVMPGEKAYRISYGEAVTLEDAVSIPDEERISVMDDGLPLYRYRNDPTNVVMSSMSLFPQEIAIGFLQDQELWEIADVVEYDGRTCWLVQGKTGRDYGSKLNVTDFEFYVDAGTGVLLRYYGYDSSGVLSDFMYTRNVRFEDEAEPVTVFTQSAVSGYQDVTGT